MRRLVTAVIAAACFACPAGALNSEYKIGMLSCSLGEPSEAPAGEAVSRDRTREVLCTFQPQEGVQETYTGTAYGVSVSANEEATFIWVVRGQSEPTDKPGQLEQTFANDSSRQPEQKPPLIGSESLALHSLSDKPEGSVSSQERSTPVGFVILRLELQLRSSIG
jgi:hypothetical protein